jgi:pimeloyl-ACP methyl ester carboxylesterase
MSTPTALHVIARAAAASPAPMVLLVHGSLDRAESFRRVMRRLPELDVEAYDRRGYQGSRAGGVVDLGGHVADLVDLATEARDRGATSVSAVGHSVGGDVVVGAALGEPRLFDSIGAFEPPMPWLGFRRAPAGADRSGGWSPLSEDPAQEVEQFFSRMVSPGAWLRLSDDGRAARRADGPALLADLTSIRAGQPFDVLSLTVPAVFGSGGEGSARHHRDTVAWLGSHVPGAESFEVPGAQHGAHLSHPDHFATFVRRVVARAAGN